MRAEELAERLRASIREVPDFPQPGISFKDITPVLADHVLFENAVSALTHGLGSERIDKVVGIESRGFIFAAPIALRLGCGFVPVRKPGKLPHQTVRVDYALEYGMDALEAHVDALQSGDRVLIVDDVLATGGTAAGTVSLIQKLGGIITGCAFVIELAGLGGREKLGGVAVRSLVQY
jgi:adenine phosphoribosyltransferase